MVLDLDVSYKFFGKNIVVVGASSGIGKQTAKEIAIGGGYCSSYSKG